MSTAARPSDFASINAILQTMYEVISGPAGQPREWHRFRALFYPGARLVPVVAPKDEPAHARLLSPDDYIQRADPIFEKEDFWEFETRRESQTFGRIAHVLSYYESSRRSGGTPFDTGVNSLQLVNDGTRWWILHVMWNTPRSE